MTTTIQLLTNAIVTSGGDPAFFTAPINGRTLKHKSAMGTEGIRIDLRRLYTLNHFVMELADDDTSYFIAVSEDNANWTRVIDYSDYTCRSVQRLYFKECSVRYIRIYGVVPYKGTFEITRFEAYYTRTPFQVDPETNIVIPSHNVAHIKENAVVIEGYNEKGSHTMLNGDTVDKSCTWRYVGTGPIIVQLPQPYMLETINLMLYDDGLYSYNMEVSTDKINWTKVIGEVEVNSWRRVTFSKQPVVFVRINGTYKSNGKWFMVRHIECPAITKV